VLRVSQAAPQEFVRRIEWPEDRFELGVVGADDDLRRIEAEPLPSTLLEPSWVLGAYQRDQAATRSRPLKLKNSARVGRDACAGYGQGSPGILYRELPEESSPYVGTPAPAGENSSQPEGGLYADELGRSRAEVYGKAAAARGHLEHPPAVDIELREEGRMNRFSPTDSIPEVGLELIHHRPEESLTEPLGRLSVAARGRLPFTARDGSQVLDGQPSDIIEAVPKPAGRSCGSSLEVIHVYVDLPIWG
jgi:hypothetical protein